MNAAWIIALFTLVGGLIGMALGELVSQEIRTRLDRVPCVLIHLAARRVPTDVRDDLAEEWLAELCEILRGKDALPVTRIITGTRYALGLLRISGSIGRELHDPGSVPSTGSAPALKRGQIRLATTPQLLYAADKGDKDAWDELVERYHRLVWSVARGHGLDDSDSADISQLTWLRMAADLDHLQGIDDLAPWLSATANHEARRRRRQR